MSQALDDRIALLAPALFHHLGADGVYARTALFERVIEGLTKLISRYRDPSAEVMRFPPVMSRAQLERTDYQNNFPQLLGGVCCLHLHGSAEPSLPGGDWAAAASTSDLVVTPAACYPVYPLVAARGAVPEKGLLFDVAADCFRREPSRQLDRLQSFRMREYVCIGTSGDVADFRERWMVRAQQIARDLGLTFRVDYASDPFFGRVGQIKAVSQKQQSLKFELLVPLRSEDKPTACMSFNYHQAHFGTTWGIQDWNGEPAHTGCVAFGMDRLAVAMFHTHGTTLAAWPAKVREMLGLQSHATANGHIDELAVKQTHSRSDPRP